MQPWVRTRAIDWLDIWELCISTMLSFFISTIQYDCLIIVWQQGIDRRQSHDQLPGSNPLNALGFLSPARDRDERVLEKFIALINWCFSKRIHVVQGWGGTDFGNVFWGGTCCGTIMFNVVVWGWEGANLWGDSSSGCRTVVWQLEFCWFET